jgi:hypothetical protein
MTNFLLFLWCSLFCFHAIGQQKKVIEFTYQPEQVFLPEKISKDVALLQSLLYKYHPNIFAYASKQVLDSSFLSFKNNLQALNERQIRMGLRKITARIGCGHTNIIPSQRYIHYYTKNDYSHLPIEVQLLNRKLFIINNLSEDSTLLLGSELLNVNGYNSQDLIQDIFDMEGSDALNLTFKESEVTLNFRYFCSLILGMNDSYFIETKDDKGAIKISQLFEKQADSLESSKKNITIKSKNKTKKAKEWAMQENHRRLKIDTLNKLAILRLDEFEGNKYKKFYKKLFKSLDEQKTENLVIDLRDNGGGKMFDACTLLSYLIDKPFAYQFKRKNNKVTFRKYLTDAKLLIGVMPCFFSLVANKTKQNDSTIFTVSYKPQKKHHFKGKIFVLSNGGTFSAATFVTSYLKNLANATLIGQETGGSEVGTNAMLFAFIKLPETQINVRLPLYRINYMLPLIDKGSNRNGVQANYKIDYTIRDILEKRDKEMEKIYEILK